jgi:hypothetical protein
MTGVGRDKAPPHCDAGQARLDATSRIMPAAAESNGAREPEEPGALAGSRCNPQIGGSQESLQKALE